MSEFWEDWYEIVEDSSLRQGDVIRSLFALAFPQTLTVLRAKPPDETRFRAEGILGDWIVMSASCDIAYTSKKYPYVLVGRILPATSDTLGAKGKKLDGLIEVMRRGWDPGRFLLAEHPNIDPPFPRSYVAFRPHLTLPFDYLRGACVGQRLRLRAPFREWFGNWVGSNFSRVGFDDKAQIPPLEGFSTEAILSLSRGIDPPAAAVAEPASVGSRITDRLPEWLRSMLGIG